MTLEAASIGALLLVALTLSTACVSQRVSRQRAIVLGAFLVASFLLVLGLASGHDRKTHGEAIIENRPVEIPQQDYVTSDECRSCHPGEYASWHASYHRTMTQVAGPESVAADFDGTAVELGGFSYRLSRDGEAHYVDIEPAPDGFVAHPESLRRRVVMTTGSHHYQVYWLETPNGREVEQFPLAYLIDEQRWLSRGATLLKPYQEYRGSYSGGWNRACIRCHSTHGRPRIRADRTIDSHVSEFGISCEACHGPATEHVRVHRDPLLRYRARADQAGDPTIVQPARLSPRRSAEVCGQCHGITEARSRAEMDHWYEHGYRFRPGHDLGATRDVVQYSWALASGDPMVDDPQRKGFFEARFWSDGMLRVVGRELNGLIDSACFTRGEMSCLSCHRMHPPEDDPRPLREWATDQLAAGMATSGACLQCHEHYAPTEALEAHTHHPASSTGSDCYNCHMPYTTYGLLKAVRSHTIDSPDVRASVEAGRPNACNQCHLDRTLSWTAAQLESWYGIAPPRLDPEQRRISATALWALRGDAGQRALAGWTLGWEPAQQASGTWWIPPYLMLLMDDSYEAVRFIAHRSLKTLPGFEEFDYDFQGGPFGRAEVAAEVLDRWEPTSAKPEIASALLLDAEGRMNETAVTRLLEERDERIVWLTE